MYFPHLSLTLNLTEYVTTPDILNADYPSWVSNIVATNKRKTYKLNSPTGTTWTVGDLNYTNYIDHRAGQFLPGKGCRSCVSLRGRCFQENNLSWWPVRTERYTIFLRQRQAAPGGPFQSGSEKVPWLPRVQELLLRKGLQRHGEKLKPSSGLPVWSNRI